MTEKVFDMAKKMSVKTRKISIKTKISISVFLVSMFCSLIIGGFSFFSFKSNLEAGLGERALDIAKTASVNIDGDKVEQYDKTEQKDESYQTMVDYLCKVKQSTKPTYLYILVDDGKQYKYIAEGFLEGETPAVLGDTQSKDDYGMEASEAISKAKGTYTAKLHNDSQYGNLLSGFAPIYNSQGKAVGVVGTDIGADVVYKTMTAYIPILLGIMFLSSIISYLLLSLIVKKAIVMPMEALEKASLKLSSGEFDIDLPNRYLKKKDEIGVLFRAFTQVADNMKKITKDISYVLAEMANKNLVVGIHDEYHGDFLPIKESINHIVKTYNDLLSNFSYVAEQVTSNSKQVSAVSQSLAQGSTEQAASIEELSQSISVVSEHATKNSENVCLATNYVSKAHEHIELSNEHMEQLLVAMNDINDTSHKISTIIKAINDIAFETNVLALNAGIEASRAGAAGRGFAVVAEEVRNLAAKSADAAQETSKLIRSSLNAVDKGIKASGVTAKALSDVSVTAQLVSDTIVEVTKASNRQAEAIGVINDGLSQIADVVQDNSATAEESAAASEDLYNHVP